MLFITPNWRIAVLGLGGLIAVAGLQALAQSAPPDEQEFSLRPSLPAESLRRAQLSSQRPQVRDDRPVGQVPAYGIPPGSGAGQSGFISRKPPEAAEGRRAGLPRGAPQEAPPRAEALPRVAAEPLRPPPENVAVAQSSPEAMVARVTRAHGAAGPVDDIATSPTRPVLEARRRLGEADPFAPVGIRSGAFLFLPALELTGGYDSNPGRVPNGRGSWFGIGGAELQVRSDWPRHEFRADLRGTYTTYETDSSLDRPFLDARANGRIDITSHTKGIIDGRLLVSTDNPGSPDLPADLSKLPIFTAAGATVGLAQSFNRFEMSLRVPFDSFDYQSSKLTNGLVVSNRDRDYDQYGVLARAGYELMPGVKPFIEAGADSRTHALEFDRSGFRRDSDGFMIKAGSAFELAQMLVGEVSLGYLARRYDDPRLQDVTGLVTDASLIWSATGLTTVTFSAATTADESTLPGVSGVLRRDAGVQVDHVLRRWLVGSFKFGYGSDDYHGSGREDDRYVLSAALTYKLTRFAWLKGEFRQEWLRSNQPGNDYDASIGVVGVRLQP